MNDLAFDFGGGLQIWGGYRIARGAREVSAPTLDQTTARCKGCTGIGLVCDQTTR